MRQPGPNSTPAVCNRRNRPQLFEDLKRGHEQSLLVSIDFLKELLDFARDVVAVEQTAEPMENEELGKAALTEVCEEARNDKTPIMVERVVIYIDEVVRYVRFDGWQNTHAGEREVKLELRKNFKYRLHQDKEAACSLSPYLPVCTTGGREAGATGRRWTSATARLLYGLNASLAALSLEPGETPPATT